MNAYRASDETDYLGSHIDIFKDEAFLGYIGRNYPDREVTFHSFKPILTIEDHRFILSEMEKAKADGEV